jgi:hypothetical protein
LNRERRALREETAWERKEQRGNHSDDKRAADSVDVVGKHCCFLLLLCKKFQTLFNLNVSSFFSSAI